MKYKMTILAIMAAVALAGLGALAFNNPNVTDLDVDIDGIADPSHTCTAEVDPGGLVAVGGARKKITLTSSGSLPDSKIRLSWETARIQLQDLGGTAVTPDGNVSAGTVFKDYAANLTFDLYVTGVVASATARDVPITLEALHNVPLSDTVRFTVVQAEYALDHVCTTAVHTATHDVRVTLKPSPLASGTKIDLELKQASGASGSAIFVGGNSITNISETKTLTVLGTQASDPISNMLMEASLDSCVFTSDVFTVVDVVKETGTEVLHPVNTTNDTTQVDDTNTVWICQTSNNTATLTLGLSWMPTNYPASEFRWDALLANGSAATEWGGPGTFVNNPTNITWTPGNPTNREFKIRTWFDCAAPSTYDATEPHRIIDVKVVDFVKLMLTNSASGRKVDETRVDEPPSTNNTLYLGETTNGTAKMAIQGWWLPEDVNTNWFRWKILLTNEASVATATTTQWLPGNNATFATNPVSVTWTNKLDANGQTNRAFKVLGWYDCDKDGAYDNDEPHRLLYVTVLKVDFEETSANSGFDVTVDPHWLVVPVNNPPNQNTAKAIITPSSAASQIYFTMDSTANATVSPSQATASPQIITITGAAKGHTALRARIGSASGPVCQTLNICVRNKQTVTVDFHYMQDNAGHSTTRSTNSAAGFVTVMNDIWTKQANVVFSNGLVDSPTVATNLGTDVWWYPTNPTNEWDDIVSFRTGGAPDIFFVWEYEQDTDPATDSVDGAYWPYPGSAGDVLMEDNAGIEVGESLAHEMGHYFNIDPYDYADHQEQLMHAYTDVRGQKITHAQVDQVSQP